MSRNLKQIQSAISEHIVSGKQYTLADFIPKTKLPVVLFSMSNEECGEEFFMVYENEEKLYEEYNPNNDEWNFRFENSELNSWTEINELGELDEFGVFMEYPDNINYRLVFKNISKEFLKKYKKAIDKIRKKDP